MPNEWIQLSITLTSLSVAGWMILPYWQALLGRPSRMLANASYTFWVLTYNVTLLAAYSAADLVLVWLRLETGAVRPSDDGGGDDGGRRRNQRRRRMAALATREPYLMTCINGNGLVFFLTANVLTGLVNLVCRPVAMAPSAGVAFAVLTVYGALLGVPVVFMHLWKLKL